MKYLVGIPCLYGVGHTKEAIESVINKEDVNVLLIDNGAEYEVKEQLRIYSYLKQAEVIHNPENIYVNPAWNQIIKTFLESDSGYLMIMNSDLILHDKWKEVMDNHFNHNSEVIPIPVISSDKNVLKQQINGTVKYQWLETHSPAGVLIILNKVQARLIYPIPETLKVWFGDNWIYNILRGYGYKIWINENLITYHSCSQNVSKVKGISEIIEQDKIEWEKLK